MPLSAEFQMVDVQGRIVRRGNLSEGYSVVKTHGLNSGWHFLRFQFERGAEVKKIFIKN
jgi:hypothetical protein